MISEMAQKKMINIQNPFMTKKKKALRKVVIGENFLNLKRNSYRKKTTLSNSIIPNSEKVDALLQNQGEKIL